MRFSHPEIPPWQSFSQEKDDTTLFFEDPTIVPVYNFSQPYPRIVSLLFFHLLRGHSSPLKRTMHIVIEGPQIRGLRALQEALSTVIGPPNWPGYFLQAGALDLEGNAYQMYIIYYEMKS